jgi:glyoxylase-like metal-dependent hydrolase (beta-lactamase superfamily II)
MLFRQVTHDDLGCASYLVGDHDAGVAAVIDPRFEIDEYLALGRYMGVHIEHILETHNHADHVSGQERFVERATADLQPQPPNFQAIVDIKPWAAPGGRGRGAPARVAPDRAATLRRRSASATSAAISPGA